MVNASNVQPSRAVHNRYQPFRLFIRLVMPLLLATVLPFGMALAASAAGCTGLPPGRLACMLDFMVLLLVNSKTKYKLYNVLHVQIVRLTGLKLRPVGSAGQNIYEPARVQGLSDIRSCPRNKTEPSSRVAAVDLGVRDDVQLRLVTLKVDATEGVRTVQEVTDDVSA